MKHDIEEFTANVERYGCWTHEIEEFYAALRRAAGGQFEPCAICLEQGTPGWITVMDHTHTQRLARCACWLRWAELRTELQAEAKHEAVAV